jgi:lysyl-tRNA synthetase class II
LRLRQAAGNESIQLASATGHAIGVSPLSRRNGYAPETTRRFVRFVTERETAKRLSEVT